MISLECRVRGIFSLNKAQLNRDTDQLRFEVEAMPMERFTAEDAKRFKKLSQRIRVNAKS